MLSAADAPAATLSRSVGIFGATMMGLGSIVGTGVFVSIAVAASVTGPSVVLAILLAALVALCNALSSAQLAADHPVSGGTYEYGYKYLTPSLGFVAGWTFLCAKSASAATAALGFAGYLLAMLGINDRAMLIAVAMISVILLGGLVASGLRRSNRWNIAIVGISMFSLTVFVLADAPTAFDHSNANFQPFFAGTTLDFANATALMFVAYTGYGRIATLGEEVIEPHRTIPRAILMTLAISAAVYIVVALVAVGAAGGSGLAHSTGSMQAATTPAAPLARIAESFGGASFGSPVARIVAIGAMTAMLGVLLNLLLGLSRVLLAMGRRGDMPRVLAKIDRTGATPYIAVFAITAIVAGLTLLGDVKTTWSFSAFTVLIYYSITNLAALGMSPAARRYPWPIAAAGLVFCALLAFCIEPRIYVAGLGMIAVGLVWHAIARRAARLR